MTRGTRNIAIGTAAGVGLAFGYSLFKRKPSIAGQVALITGGSRGLGLRLAEEFSLRGCKIAICARNEVELAEAKRLLVERGCRDVFAHTCDVSDQDQVETMVRAVKRHHGRIEILVNNAGQIRVGPLANMTMKDFNDAMGVMFWGVVHCSLAVLPEMEARRQGRIATIASVGGKVSIPHLLPYSCAKHAAVAFSEGLHAEVAKSGIKVTTIAPGLMRTGSHKKAEFKGQQEKEAAWFSLGATLPVVSMDIDRAAVQIVDAIVRGESERILSPQASLLARMNGALPGMIPEILGLVEQFMPKGTNNLKSISDGNKATGDMGSIFGLLTTLGTRAAAKYNEG